MPLIKDFHFWGRGKQSSRYLATLIQMRMLQWRWWYSGEHSGELPSRWECFSPDSLGHSTTRYPSFFGTLGSDGGTRETEAFYTDFGVLAHRVPWMVAACVTVLLVGYGQECW